MFTSCAAQPHVAQAVREAWAIPNAVAAGVRTPQLIVFDPCLDILPVPFLIVELVDGTDAEAMAIIPPDALVAWQDLGADLARLHRFSPASDPPAAWLTDLLLHLPDRPWRELAPAAVK